MRPQHPLRLYTFLVLVLALLVATVVLLGGEEPTSTARPPSPGLQVDRIAYVGLDGQIRTVNPDGSGDLRISPQEGIFTWPTWSPDGQEVAFSGVIGVDGGQRQYNLYSLNTMTGQSSEIHLGEPGATRLVAQGAPHYILWSPDSTHLAFIGTTASGLRLYVDDLGDDIGPKPALDGSPLWLDWSPDSRFILVHRGPDHFLLDSALGIPTLLDIPAAGLDVGYNVPVWRPLGDTITFVGGDTSQGYTLYTSGRDALNPRPVAEVPQGAAFSWSPDGQVLAVASPNTVGYYQPLGLRVFSRVSLYSAEGSKRSVEITENVVAFFWSPDSTKLAYVTFTDVPGVLRWKVVTIADGTRWRVMDFLPSLGHLTVLQFFDQYARSHSVWSPDSTSLVISGRLAALSQSAGYTRQPVDQIIVLGTQQPVSFQVIADGFLGFWSPR